LGFLPGVCGAAHQPGRERGKGWGQLVFIQTGDYFKQTFSASRFFLTLTFDIST
jgi:hypothetical protein